MEDSDGLLPARVSSMIWPSREYSVVNLRSAASPNLEIRKRSREVFSSRRVSGPKPLNGFMQWQ